MAVRLPAIAQRNRTVREFPLDSAATFVHGAAALVDTADGEVVEAGTDPALILGFAEHDAAADPLTTIVLVAVALPTSTFLIEASAALVASDVGKSYGLTKDGTSGVWFLDKAKTGASARALVEEVDLTRALAEISILQTNRQFDQ